MKFAKRLLIVGLVIAVFVGGACFWLSDKYVVPIVMYHKVENSQTIETDTISPQNFRRHMDYISRRGYNVLTLDEFVEGVKSGKEFPRNSVVITFDDGFADFYTTAYPVLERYGFSATVFLPAGMIGRKVNGLPCMNWDHIRELADKGISFGSHSMTHPKLVDLDPDELNAEIGDSKDTIVDGIQDIVGIIQTKLPQTKIVLLGLFPRNRNETGIDYMRKIDRINRQLQGFYADSQVAFRDLGPLILGGHDVVSNTIMPDGLHLNYAGYEIIGPELKHIIDEFWS